MANGLAPLKRFRERVLGGEVLAGTFQKTPSRQVGEILARSGLDFAILDAEHGPFGIAAIDDVVAPARGLGFPMLVRVPELRPSLIGACLDAGAGGIVVPHVTTQAHAAAAVAAVKFARGIRGLSPSGRGGDYGAFSPADFMDLSDAATTVWCQIEDVEGVENIAAICRTPDVDALFVGRVDLMRSLGATSVRDPAVVAAVATVAAAARGSGIALAIFIATPEEAETFRPLGFTLFVCGSDQSLLKAAAGGAGTAITALLP